jgi:phosphoribosyl 1,2-cyclic phosphate phosphodiesterase
MRRLWHSLVLTAVVGALGAFARAAEEPYVVFLGTGAADIETPKRCGCETCTYIREHGGRNARRFSSLFVAPDIVIDYSTTGRDGLAAAGIMPAAVNHLVLTHSHGDHFNETEIVALAEARAKEKAGPLEMWGDPTVVEKMRAHIKTLDREVPITVHEVRPYQEVAIGDWKAKALPANHDPNEDCLLWVLRRGERAFFYATDTGWFPVGTFNALRAERLDLAIVEGTFGPLDGPEYLTGHLNFAFDRLIRRFVFEQKVMKPGATFALTHLSLHAVPPYDRIHETMAKEGILIPYDGLRLTVAAQADRAGEAANE